MSDLYELTIDKIVAGGLGLGRRADGVVVLVAHVLPGERVLVRTVGRRKTYIEAQLVEVLEPAAGRIVAQCPAYRRCGGCDLQHVDYAGQLAVKQNILIETVCRSLKIAAGELAGIVQAPLAAVEPFNYRQRIRLQIDHDSARLGFYRPGTHIVEPVVGCQLARPELNKALQEIRTQASPALLQLGSSLELLLSAADQAVVVLLNFSRRPRPADLAQARTLIAASSLIKEILFSVPGHGVIASNGKRADSADAVDLLEFTLPMLNQLPKELRLCLEPGGFCQVNQGQNEQLVALLLEWAEVDREHRVLDLFCGMGNFSLPLAVRAGAVIGFDLQRSAIRSANRNAQEAGFMNCRFEAKDARLAAMELAVGTELFDLVLLDPPRGGCAQVVPYLSDLAAEKIIYISCDPATIARDLIGIRAAGFRLDRLRIVDMFPQTHHLEVIARLVRADR